MEISGATRLYVIVADPVQHVRTPQAFNARFAAANGNAVMIAAEVAPGELRAFVHGLKSIRNMCGLVVTVPHKQSIVAYCDELTPQAQRAGSVNAVRFDAGRWIGANFDGLGFLGGLARARYAVEGKRVLLLGSGGAAAAIAFTLADSGISQLRIFNRSLDKSAKLAEELRAACRIDCVATDNSDTNGIDLIINATSLGLKPSDPLPIPAERIYATHMVAEVVMQPAETSLLAAARAAGARIHPGHFMLEAQIEMIGRHIGAFADEG